MVKTRKVDVELKDKDGKILFKKDGFEVPEFWSDTSAQIAAEKYATNNETSVFQIFDRVVDTIVGWGREQDYFEDEEGTWPTEGCLHDVVDCSSCNEGCRDSWTDWTLFSDDLKDALINQKISFSSPIFFNLGSPGHYPQVQACYLGEVKDDLVDILEHTQRAGKIFRSGSGIGINVSKIRAEGETLSNRGKSSGVLSFMRMWDKAAGVIKSGGKTRRSAVLIGMETDHPDIEKFIHCKSEEERKAQVLISAGYSKEDAYATIDYQNANHSVIVSDKFMEAVEKDEDWQLTNRVDGKAAKVIKAKQLFQEIVEQAHSTGDPGLQFTDTINRFNPLKNVGKIEISNPCGEIYGIPFTACLLSSINIVKFYDQDLDEINYKELGKAVDLLVRSMDMMIDEGYYATEDFKRIAQASRPIGLGLTNLGALIMLKGMSYDSQEARDFVQDLYRKLTSLAAKSSIELAKELSPFEMYADNAKHVIEVFNEVTGDSEIGELIAKYGIRNSQVTTAMPTGSVSFLMGADTTGPEPLYSAETIKELSGGGSLYLRPKCVEDAMRNLGYDPKEDKIKDMPEKHVSIFKSANDLGWDAHVKMTAAVNKGLSSGVSKTINLPSDATVEDVKGAYLLAWKLGCKGITVYRDGCKGMQPLRDANKTEEAPRDSVVATTPEVVENTAPALRLKPLDTRNAITHKVDIGGHSVYVTAGTYPDGSLCEIFIRQSLVGSAVSGMMDAFATSISLGLQYGVPLEKFIEKYKNTKFDPSGFTSNPDIQLANSILDYIFKWLELQFIINKPDEYDEEDSYVELEEHIISNPNTPIEPKDEVGGELCLNCGNITRRLGGCTYCDVCHSQTGCGG